MGIPNLPTSSPPEIPPQSSSATMKYLAVIVATVLAAATAAPGWHKSSYSNTRTAPAPRTPQQNIAERAIATPALSPLVAAVQAAGLVETLSGPGPFTVFAPTNDAFAKIPSATLNGLLADKEALTAVLLRHVVPSVIRAEDIPAGRTMVGTAGGENVSVVNDGVVTIAGAATAKVIATNILASNGVVHLVDTVF